MKHLRKITERSKWNHIRNEDIKEMVFVVYHRDNVGDWISDINLYAAYDFYY